MAFLPWVSPAREIIMQPRQIPARKLDPNKPIRESVAHSMPNCSTKLCRLLW